MKCTVQLESKDIRTVIAKFFGIKNDDVIPNRYSYSIVNLSPEEIQRKLDGDADKEDEK